jgi:hypothetical protein
VFLPIYYAIAIAILFDVLVPVAVLLVSERVWTSFRSRLFELSAAPLLSYADLAAKPATPMARRFFGQVEAIEGSDQLWVRGTSCSVVVDFSGSPFYVLGNEGGVERLNWKKVHSLAEGMKLFVAGDICLRDGKPLFVGQPGRPLIAVSYDVEDERLLPLLGRGARTRGWLAGRAALASAGIGLGLFTIAFLALSSSPMLESVRFISILIALSPLLVFLPPGDLFLWLATKSWRGLCEARMASAEARFSLPSEAQEARQDGAPWPSLIRKDFILAAFFLALSFACNFSLAIVAFRLLVR